MSARPPLAALALVAACQGNTGTISLELVTAPGSTVLDAVTDLRLTLTEPPAVFEATRGERGFSLSLEVEAEGQTGALIVEGFDGSGALVVAGMSPTFQVGPVDARIVIYVAAPLSIEPAPVALVPARDQVAIGSLAYGAVIAGGRVLDTGAASDAIAIYNAYDHTLIAGKPMPGPRIDIALGTSGTSSVFLLGGEATADTPTSTAWRFQTTAAPNGAYAVLPDEPSYARAGEQLVPIGSDRFLATGTPVLEIDVAGVRVRSELAGLGPGGADVFDRTGVRSAVFADAAGITQFRADTFSSLSTTPRPGARTVALPDRTALVAGDGSGEAVRVDPETGVLTTIPGLIPTTCTSPAMAATPRHLLIACATETHVFDVQTLAPLSRLARSATAMTSLPNGQVLLVGGTTGLQLFTPGPPAR